MRIIIFSYWYHAPKVAAKRINSWRKSLQDAGYEVIIFTSHSGKNILIDKHQQIIQLPSRENIFQRLFFSEFGKKNPLFSGFIYSLYLFFFNRDIYDFFYLYKKYEKETGLKINSEDVVITSSPPYSTFDIGNYLHKKYKMKWIMDYRDPWNLAYRPVDSHPAVFRFRKFRQQKIEEKYLNSAYKIICVSDPLKKSFPKSVQQKVILIPNGFDQDQIDFSKIEEDIHQFLIVYAGTIYNDQLKDETFFKAVNKFLTDNKISTTDFSLKFVGTGNHQKLNKLIEKYGLERYTECMDWLPQKKELDILYKASLFLQLKWAHRKEILGSKHATYMALQKKILLPLSDYGVLEESILSNDQGYVCYSEQEIVQVLQKEFHRFKNRESCIHRYDSITLQSWSRAERDKKLLELISEAGHS